MERSSFGRVCQHVKGAHSYFYLTVQTVEGVEDPESKQTGPSSASSCFCYCSHVCRISSAVNTYAQIKQSDIRQDWRWNCDELGKLPLLEERLLNSKQVNYRWTTTLSEMMEKKLTIASVCNNSVHILYKKWKLTAILSQVTSHHHDF